MIFLTSPGKTYSVNSVGGCTISAGGTTLATIPANVQTTFIAPDEEVLVSDNNAIIVEVTGVGAGGSGGTGEGGSGGVTAEEIKAVVPIAFGTWTTPPTAGTEGSVCIGEGANANSGGLAIGQNAKSVWAGEAFGQNAQAIVSYSTAVGLGSSAIGAYSLAIGCRAVQTTGDKAITIGSNFLEVVDGSTVTNSCSTQGAGSITIGAGANTLNTKKTVNGVETTVASSNSVTIGCKALNQVADSVVIGAQARTSEESVGVVAIGAEAKALKEQSVAIGKNSSSGAGGAVAIGGNATAYHNASVAIGYNSLAGSSSVSVGQVARNEVDNAVCLGVGTSATQKGGIAIGYNARVADKCTVVLRSFAWGEQYSTNLYFAGANTPLAVAYEGGEAMMGYVVRDEQTKEIVAAGTQKLSVLFPNNSTFQPATLGLDDEMTPPKVFHPSDLDLPVEEPTEPEEYTPLPVYPIVEPEIEELPSES